MRNRLLCVVTLMLVLGLSISVNVAADQSMAQKKGWCCNNGQVYPATVSQCKMKGGTFFKTRAEAEKYCKSQKKGFCCKDGRVFAATAGDCKIEKGKFFPRRMAAENFCKSSQNKWRPITQRTIRRFALKKSLGQGASKLVKPQTKILGKSLLSKIGPGVLKMIGNPGHGPIEPTADCSPTVHMWIMPEKPDNVYFTDEDITVYYSVDCATSVGVDQVQFFSTAEALDIAESGVIPSGGSSGTYYRDAAAAGVLTGNRHFAPGSTSTGVYRWSVQASNNLNPANPSDNETIAFQVITRPSMDSSCADYRDCITDMVTHVAPLIDAGIINNRSLDDSVEAFRDGIYNRRVIGLRIKRELETMATGTNIECTSCSEYPAHYSESDPDTIVLDFCPPWYPTDYALVHELTHKVGFDSRLIRAYMDAGIWERTTSGTPLWREYVSRVEEMTAAVSGAPFDRSRICTEY